MIPLFPLQTVVYPGEQLPLHIFEKRYQQLIEDSENGATFGIPTVVEKKLKYGTEVKLVKIAQKYPNGESDIVCQGIRVFKIKKFYKQFPGKLYAGADVEFLEDEGDGTVGLQEELLTKMAVLYVELTIDSPPKFNIPFVSYQVAHKVALTLPQEYYLLKLRNELSRLKFLIEHIKITIPVVKEMNRAKKMIKMNGHFRNFDPLDFKDYQI